jgi:hypothetical protein
MRKTPTLNKALIFLKWDKEIRGNPLHKNWFYLKTIRI